jgi:hypothetical protein
MFSMWAVVPDCFEIVLNGKKDPNESSYTSHVMYGSIKTDIVELQQIQSTGFMGEAQNCPKVAVRFLCVGVPVPGCFGLCLG